LIRLGSNSPTRALILKILELILFKMVVDFDEDSIKQQIQNLFVMKQQKENLMNLYKKYGIVDMPLLVADSVVTCEGKLLRKAKDLADAKIC
jgi:septum formation protein